MGETEAQERQRPPPARRGEEVALPRREAPGALPNGVPCFSEPSSTPGDSPPLGLPRAEVSLSAQKPPGESRAPRFAAAERPLLLNGGELGCCFGCFERRGVRAGPCRGGRGADELWGVKAAPRVLPLRAARSPGVPFPPGAFFLRSQVASFRCNVQNAVQVAWEIKKISRCTVPRVPQK